MVLAAQRAHADSNGGRKERRAEKRYVLERIAQQVYTPRQPPAKRCRAQPLVLPRVSRVQRRRLRHAIPARRESPPAGRKKAGRGSVDTLPFRAREESSSANASAEGETVKCSAGASTNRQEGNCGRRQRRGRPVRHRCAHAETKAKRRGGAPHAKTGEEGETGSR